MGIGATIYFMIKGVTAVESGESEKIKNSRSQRLKEVIDQAIKSGVKMMVFE
jgi:predicted peroxiredoxin